LRGAARENQAFENESRSRALYADKSHALGAASLSPLDDGEGAQARDAPLDPGRLHHLDDFRDTSL
jgi:hypothetical protein